MQSETIGLAGKRRDADSERHALLNKGMNAVSRGEMSSKEVSQQLARADIGRLPVELVSRLLDPDYYDTAVMNSRNGLAMYAPRGEGTPNFDLLSEEVEDVEELVADGGMDPDTYENLPVRGAITHDALQLEPYLDRGERLRTRAHNSFGYTVEGVGYVPVVTVLSPEHPVRQLIDERRQEQTV